MKVYATEEEQVQALVGWFKRNGKILSICLLAVILTASSWTFWQSQNAKYIGDASALYEKLQKSTDQLEQIKVAKELSDNYKSSIYGKVGALFLANQKAADKKWSDVVSEYKWIYENTSKWPDLQIIVFENWIRTQLELKKIDEAYENIVAIENKSKLSKLYPLNFYNLKADVLAMQQKNIEAIESYNIAIDSAGSNPELQQQTAQFINWVVLKRNDLLAAKPLA